MNDARLLDILIRLGRNYHVSVHSLSILLINGYRYEDQLFPPDISIENGIVCKDIFVSWSLYMKMDDEFHYRITFAGMWKLRVLRA